jgi:hypothetical protein
MPSIEGEVQEDPMDTGEADLTDDPQDFAPDAGQDQSSMAPPAQDQGAQGQPPAPQKKPSGDMFGGSATDELASKSFYAWFDKI